MKMCAHCGCGYVGCSCPTCQPVVLPKPVECHEVKSVYSDKLGVFIPDMAEAHQRLHE